MERRQSANRGASASSTVPVGLDPEAIIEAAVALIDDRGVDGFTVRALGERLGVSAPTIYWHVGSKSELLEKVVDHVVADMDVTVESSGEWQVRLRRFLDEARRQLLAHPNVMDLMGSVHSSVFERWSTTVVEIMSDAGFDDAEAAACARAVLLAMTGAIRSEVNVRTVPYMERVPGESHSAYRVKASELNPDLDPRISLVASYDLDDQYELTTDILIAGINARLSPGA